MKIAHSGNVGREICEALGLEPKRVVSLQISIEPDNPVRVKVTLLTGTIEMGVIGQVVREYKLVPKDDIEEVTALGSVAKEFRATN